MGGLRFKGEKDCYTEFMEKIFLPGVIPAYSKKGNLKKVFFMRFVPTFLNRGYLWEVLIVDDGLTDRTLADSKDITEGQRATTYLRWA